MLAVVVYSVLERLHHVLGWTTWGSELGLQLVLINIELLLVDIDRAISLHAKVTHMLIEVSWRFPSIPKSIVVHVKPRLRLKG